MFSYILGNFCLSDSWGPLGALLGLSGALLALYWGSLGLSWASLALSWGSLGTLLGRFGVFLGALGALGTISGLVAPLLCLDWLSFVEDLGRFLAPITLSCRAHYSELDAWKD